MKVNAQITSLLLCFTKMLFALFVMAAAPEALGQDNVVVQ